jgi:predicted alpha/beta-fold hydrolase
LVTPKYQNFGSTEDLEDVISHIKANYPKAPLYLVGFSMGANLSVRYCGQKGEKSQVDGVVSISNPFNIGAACHQISSMKYAVYGNYMGKNLVEIAFKNRDQVSLIEKRKGITLDWDRIAKCKNPLEFDQHFSMPILDDPTDLDSMYKALSCQDYIEKIPDIPV